jgi:meso-butanediol dehydrogenase/(S,S)-butanediol dehydrogenase/diacetyl reductase
MTSGNQAPRALVTGGSSGMGLAVARRFVARGVDLMICGKNLGSLEEARRELTAKGACETICLDLSTPDGPAAAVEECASRLGGIEVLVNNAGIAEFCDFGAMTVESWGRSIDLMARAPMLATQAAAAHMKAAGGGRVINNASISASLSEPGSAQYSAAKAAVISLTKTTAVDLAADGIRANAVAPGWIRTPLSEQFLAEADPESVKAINPVGRVGDPDEVAAVIEFLALDAPDYLTGETIHVDGGQAVYLPLP